MKMQARLLLLATIVALALGWLGLRRENDEMAASIEVTR